MNASTPPAGTDNSLRLSDGRRLGYAEYGDPAGAPVLFFHGAPGSRRSIFADMATTAAQRGLRMVAVERPGYGLSDPLPGCSVQSWAEDVKALTLALGIARFSLIGFSVGSFYALAFAHALPAQVERVAIVGGMAPLTVAGVDAGRPTQMRAIYDLARADPNALRAAMAPMAASAAGLVDTMASLAADVDKKLFAARRLCFAADYAETLCGGVEGVAADLVLVSNAWTFPLDKIEAKVDLWVGAEDCNTPPAMSRYLDSVLPHSALYELPGAGHFCLYTHWQDILGRLANH